MSAYVVVDINVTDPGPYEEYRRLAQESIALHGGRYLARGGKTTTLEGEWVPSRLVILEFESAEQARKWWDSPEYTRARAVRATCASGNFVLVEGLAAQKCRNEVSPCPQWERSPVSSSSSSWRGS